MFCSNCGTQVQDGEKFCPNCGAPVTGASEIKGFTLNEEKQATNGGNFSGSNGNFSGNGNTNGTENFNGNDNGNFGGNGSYTGTGNMGGGNGYNGPTVPLMPLKTDRSFWMYLLLSWVTCGIYSLIFLYELIKDVNVACEGDGEDTPSFWMLLLLSFVTCGIYSFIWYYKLGNRLAKNNRRYGFNVSEDGVTVLLWMVLSSWICGLGAYVAQYIIINQTNNVCMGYNRANGIA